MLVAGEGDGSTERTAGTRRGGRQTLREELNATTDKEVREPVTGGRANHFRAESWVEIVLESRMGRRKLRRGDHWELEMGVSYVFRVIRKLWSFVGIAAG